MTISSMPKIFVLYITQYELDRAQYKLDKLGLDVTYFKGVDGKLEREKKDSVCVSTLSNGSYGHACSFINILKEAISNDYKKILILEPDVYLATDFLEKLSKSVSRFDNNYKMLYLGASQGKFYKENSWDIIDSKYSELMPLGYYLAYKTLGTFAVILDNNIFEEYLNMLHKFELSSDVCLTKLQEKYVGECYVVYPNIVCCDVTVSTTSERAFRVDQLDAMKVYRWMGISYNFEDRYNFVVQRDGMYVLVFDVNSFLKGYSLKLLYGSEYSNVTVRELKLLNIFCKKKDARYRLYFKARAETVYVLVNNLFINRVEINPVKRPNKFNRPFGDHIDKIVVDKNIKSDLAKYYSQLLC